ncbi:hypothetical protein Bca52824_095298 [Brassica carinata]|uniref:Uncharacterized protein n=1 Tax=Brassica carinata TaxID=52824 RepID=A0A8X7P0H7_BRACI|nr:hypothetical protein Bca52824_095298 [Brassica carinata]
MKEMESKTILSWWHDDERRRSRSGEEKCDGQPKFDEPSFQKEALARGIVSPKFKARGNSSRSGPNPKPSVGYKASSNKKQKASSSHSSMAQNEKLADTLTRM